jgi:hypothetical protein
MVGEKINSKNKKMIRRKRKVNGKARKDVKN